MTTQELLQRARAAKWDIAAADTAAIRGELGDTAAELYEISADKQQRCCLLIAHRAEEEKVQELLRPFNFSAVSFQGYTGTAAENADRLERQLEENRVHGFL